MKIENIHVYGFEMAFHGMRNPMNSWERNDSEFGEFSDQWLDKGPPLFLFNDTQIRTAEHPYIGPNDLELAKKLIKGGTEHRKFLRQIQVWVNFTLPRYVWTELDTYKVSTVRNSCSTMHKLGVRDLTQDDFELPLEETTLNVLNKLCMEFRTAKKDKDSEKVNRLRHELKNLLPEGFLQKSTYTMNYETAMSMYYQRRNHRLSEWNESNPESICSFLKSLPYMDEFIDA